MKSKIKVVLFTHPTCTGCRETYRRFEQWEKERDDLSFKVQSLAGPRGHALAEKWHIRSVPTVIFNDDPELRITGIPRRQTMEEMLRKINAQ